MLNTRERQRKFRLLNRLKPRRTSGCRIVKGSRMAVLERKADTSVIVAFR